MELVPCHEAAAAGGAVRAAGHCARTALLGPTLAAEEDQVVRIAAQRGEDAGVEWRRARLVQGADVVGQQALERGEEGTDQL